MDAGLVRSVGHAEAAPGGALGWAAGLGPQGPPHLLIFSFWECSPSSTAPSGSISTLVRSASWNIWATGMVDPSRTTSGSVPNTETQERTASERQRDAATLRGAPRSELPAALQPVFHGRTRGSPEGDSGCLLCSCLLLENFSQRKCLFRTHFRLTEEPQKGWSSHGPLTLLP